MRTRRPLSRGVPAPLDGDALTNGARWLAVAGGVTGGDGMNLDAIETAIRAVAAAKVARQAFEAHHGGREGYVLVLDTPLYQQYRRIVATYHKASSTLWRAVNQAVEEAMNNGND